MTTSTLWARGLCRALLTATALATATSAYAQGVGEGGPGDQQAKSGNISPPAEKLAVSPGGVDMRTGQYAYSQTDLSIGEASESGGIALTRTMNADVPGHINPFANFSHNWDVMVSTKNVNILDGDFEDGAGSDLQVGVHFGGRSETFRRQGLNSYFEQVSKNPHAQLTWAGSTYTFQATDGTLAVFRPLGDDCATGRPCAFVSTITLPDNTRFAFEYDQPGTTGANATRLRSVTSTRGYALLLEYGTGADIDHVTKACVINLTAAPKPSTNACPTGAVATSSYSYTSFAGVRRMASATDAAGNTSGFTYSGTGSAMQMGFVKPGASAPWLVNSVFQTNDLELGSRDAVSAQAFADGSSFTYNYTLTPFVNNQPMTIAGGNYIDAANAVTTVEFGFERLPYSSTPLPQAGQHPFVNFGDIVFQTTPGPVKITDPLGRETVMDYCDPTAMANLPSNQPHRCLVSILQSFTDPEGIRTELSYDSPWMYRNVIQARRKAKAGSGLADIVTSSTYDYANPKLGGKPLTTTDANNNVTTYTYDSAHGGVTSVTGPAVYSGGIPVQPQTRHDYAQRYAWISNGLGGHVQASHPIWLLTATRYCKTSAATGNPASPCATAGDEVVTTFDYGPDSGPNNLVLRGKVEDAGGLALRTCFGTDAQGNTISETAPSAGLTSCP